MANSLEVKGESLFDVKKRLSLLYLGASIIQGLGINRKDNTVRVYVDSDICKDEPDKLNLVVDKITNEAKPYKVDIVKTEPVAMDWQ